jgi:hypothetical protein
MHKLQSLDKGKQMRIIYKTEEGGVAVLIPAPEYLQDHTIEELAAKDVPEGAEFEIVEDADVPSDRTFREAWTWA